MNQPEASLAIQILPTVESDKVIPVVDEVIAYIKSQNLNAFVGPFETTIEGDLDTLFDVAKECHKVCVKAGAAGAAVYMKMFYNPNTGVHSIEEKTAKHQD